MIAVAVPRHSSGVVLPQWIAIMTAYPPTSAHEVPQISMKEAPLRQVVQNGRLRHFVMIDAAAVMKTPLHVTQVAVETNSNVVVKKTFTPLFVKLN